MSITMSIEVDNPNVEKVLQFLDGLNLSQDDSEDVLRRACLWVNMRGPYHGLYAPRVTSLELKVGGVEILKREKES
jgi:hypothetical protein